MTSNPTPTITALIDRVSTVSQVAIALQPAYALSGPEAAEQMAAGRRVRPWMGWANGMETALTMAEYEQLREMGAEVVSYWILTERREKWWDQALLRPRIHIGKLGPDRVDIVLGR